MARSTLIINTLLAMTAFAANSLLCRAALNTTNIDPASFTSIRLLSGAAVLYVIFKFKTKTSAVKGNPRSAAALFIYAACFSFAYGDLTTATGALLLFGAVQTTMIGYGLWRGERLNSRQWLGVITAIIGLFVLMFPGLRPPPAAASVLMIISGVAWGAYSLRARGVQDPSAETAGNFLRTAPMTIVLSALCLPLFQWDAAGIALAVLSGAVASGLGYTLWYAVLPHIAATRAATVQLSAPVIASLMGVVFLQEALTWNLGVATLMVISGVWLVLHAKRQ
ncbi:MAG: DMT family transporter [Gammaproteobacteria bacterium]|nr:DMT family transporter [Gammaproteobacteria bacterium]